MGDTVTLDVLLRGIYAGMLDRLRAGAVDGALQYVTWPMRQKFEAGFRAAGAGIGGVIDQLGVMESGWIGDDIAQYYVVRDEAGELMAFPVFFVQGEDGVWRIGSM